MNIQGGGGVGGGGGGENNQSHGGGGGNNQSQLQVQPPQAQPQQPPPRQRCPRCDSVNTKFCYYNNYSLSQPRYFCKTCKRYWTHGGSLRNIPIGGGCRKGKRTKTTLAVPSSSATLQLMNQAPQLQPNAMTLPTSGLIIGGSSVVAAAPAVPSISSYYQGGGGYLSSPSQAIQSQNPSTQPLFNLSSLNLAPSSSLGLHPWFNPPSTLASKSHIPQSSAAVFQSESLYPSDHHNQGLVQTSVNMMGNSSYASFHDWSQNPLWSTVSTTSIGDNSGSPSNINNDQINDNNANKAVGSSSLSGNQWSDHLPAGYGSPP